jgi:RHH-type rel operon transcriptional repressor/antitoxin RelB
MLAIRLPAEIEGRLAALAQATGRSKASFAREAILAYLDDLEDISMADRELEAVRAGQSTTTPLADVMKRYGMAS